MKPLYFVIAACVVGLGLFLSVFLGDAQKTLPKIKLSYFSSTDEVSEAVEHILQQEMLNEKSFWVGVEPEKKLHVELAASLVKSIEQRNGKFDMIFVDEELKLPPEQMQLFPNATPITLREKWGDFAEQIQTLNDKKYFVLTASIYTTTFLKQNPIAKIKEKNQIKPFTFSTGYFSANTEDEKNGLFPCASAEDRTGINEWGCAMVNKSRSQRRRIEDTKKPIMGLMDLTGEKDYMILIR